MLNFFKATEYQLRMDDPCSENWDKMLSADGGKFCQSCSKNVIDFTNLSDKEIVQIISKSKGSLCGRLSNNQLNRSITFKKEIKYPIGLTKIAAGFLLVGLSENIHAGSTSNAPDIEFSEALKNTLNQKQTLIDSTIIVFKGTVLDSLTKKGIPGATILLKNSTYTVAADMDGNFVLNILKDTLEKDITIIISAIGFSVKEINLNQNNLTGTTEFFLVYDPSQTFELMGLLVTEVNKQGSKNLISKKKWWQFRKRNT